MGRRKRPEKPEECRCGSGDYCPLHRGYNSYRTSGEYDLSEDHGEHRADLSVRCGGGRRIIRKKIGGV